MALVRCKECGSQISSKAEACPSCGAKQKKPTSLLTKLLAGFFAVGIIGALFGHHDGATTAAAATPSAAQPVASSTADLSAMSASKPRGKAGKSLAALRKKTDKIEGIDWYSDPSSPTSLNSNNVSVYLGMRQGGSPWLRLKMQYTGSEWLFIHDAVVVVNGQKFATVTGSWKRDNNTEVFEWLDIAVDSDNLAAVRAMATAKEVTIRYEGQQYYRDQKLSGRELIAMQHVLAAYAEAGGT